MLENLSQRLAKVVKTIRGEARLTESNTQEMLREIRLALLEADVALSVVRDFVAKIKERAMGQEVMASLTPGQALVGVVHDALVDLMGGKGDAAKLNLATQPPAVILLAGLQGAGKTTTAGKLAKWLAEQQKKKVLTVSCDVYRPAAIEQLRVVSAQVGADYFPSLPSQKPEEIAQNALQWARTHFHDVLIVDTAGRLGIDEAMMAEISRLHQQLKPIETLFVVDAMQGQDAVNTAKAFGEALELTGVILTKLDGDSRGGAALSVKAVTGRPIKFVGVSEKPDGLQAFDAERMSNRVLGMGDIVALVEQARAAIDEDSAKALADKLKSGARFDLEDYLAQLMQMRKMGGLSTMLDKLPAAMQAAAGKADMNKAERELKRTQGIIHAMTPAERAKPDLIKASRKRRIATGAGVQVQEVNRMLAQFDQMQGMMKKMQKGGMAKLMRSLGGLAGMGKGGMPGGFGSSMPMPPPSGGFGKRGR
jgi:signal recognition particle subunit SRP54